MKRRWSLSENGMTSISFSKSLDQTEELLWSYDIRLLMIWKWLLYVKHYQWYPDTIDISVNMWTNHLWFNTSYWMIDIKSSFRIDFWQGIFFVGERQFSNSEQCLCLVSWVRVIASNPWPASFPAWPALYILSKPYKAARGVSYGTIPVIQPRMEGVTMKDWGNISIR